MPQGSNHAGHGKGRTAIAAALACCALAPLAPAAAAQTPEGAEFVPGELLVRFDPGVDRAESRQIAGELDARITERLDIVPNLTLVDLPPGTGVEEADALFARADGVRSAEPNFLYELADDVPDDTGFPLLWGLDNTGQAVNGTAGLADADIDAPAAWDPLLGGTFGDPSVKVGVIDSGLTADHPDLQGNFVDPGTDVVDFVEDDSTPDDENSHGSHVAGTIGAVGDNTGGITGVSRSVGLVGLKAGGASGSLPLSNVVEAIGYARDEGVKVVNGSFSGGGGESTFTNAMANAPGVLFVVAAGNGGSDGVGDDNDSDPQFPCNVNLLNVICVAASGQTDQLASFSNFGSDSVDLAAPGVNTLSTIPVFESPAAFSDTFDTDDFATRWNVAGGVNGTWSRIGSPGSGQMVDSPIGVDYLPNADLSAELADPLDLTGKVDCRTRMSLTRDIGTGDRLVLEAMDLNAMSPAWEQLGSALQTSANGTVMRELRGVNPSTGQPLTDFDGKASVKVRVRLVSDGGTTPTHLGEGATVDNFVIECRKTPLLPNEGYGYKNGTSMATPHVAGVAALLLADDPTLTVSQLRNTLLASVDPVASMKCRTFTGGRLNAARALALSPVNTPPATTCTPNAPVQLPVVEPPEEPAKKKAKCKRPKKGASAKAKAKARKKCKRLKAQSK